MPHRQTTLSNRAAGIAGYLISASLLAALILNLTGLLLLRIVATSSMQGTINQGSLVVADSWEKPVVGDIAVYQIELAGGKHAQLVHRVIAEAPNGLLTFRGDNNQIADPTPVKPEQVRGKVVFWIPGIGNLAALPLICFIASILVLVWVVRSILNDRVIEMIGFNHVKASWWMTPVKVGLFAITFATILFTLYAFGLFRVMVVQNAQPLSTGKAQDLVLVIPNTQIRNGSTAIAIQAGKAQPVKIIDQVGSKAHVESPKGTVAIPRKTLIGEIRLSLPLLWTKP